MEIKINTQSSIKIITNKIIYFDPYLIKEPSHDAELLVKSFELGVGTIFQEYGKKFLNIKFRREAS